MHIGHFKLSGHLILLLRKIDSLRKTLSMQINKSKNIDGLFCLVLNILIFKIITQFE